MGGDRFRNFVLQLNWLSFNPTGPNNDNSGEFLRFPALNASNPGSDWQLAVDRGYEVQIGDTGFNPDTGLHGDPLHQTGAVYGLGASSRVASNPAGSWNTYVIEATTAHIRVTLNGQLVTDYATDGSRPPATSDCRTTPGKCSSAMS
ncbi:MAG: Glucosemethanolcholine oxidoreductaseNAD binding site [Gemmataceae bacterium]|nr:Glucosemethanolcholine oxidoreductaseNAD binding site [Gemmataceae bacterium]